MFVRGIVGLMFVQLCWMPALSLAEEPSQADLEKKFAQQMSGVQLTGKFTVEGKVSAEEAKEEKYIITKVTKIEGDIWLFTARVVYGDKDITVPMPLPVKWAGDTPVVSLTETTIPGLGTFTARVMFYENYYLGFWQHGENRGQMWGTISKLKSE